MRKVDTLRFGTIEIEEEKITHFPHGIPAFEEEKEFIIVPYDSESPYLFMQSLSTPDLAFLITMPFLFFPDYEFELDDSVQKELGIKDQEDMLIYVLITIPGGKSRPSRWYLTRAATRRSTDCSRKRRRHDSKKCSFNTLRRPLLYVSTYTQAKTADHDR